MIDKGIKLSQQAIEDLKEIWLYIAIDSPDIADKFIDEIYNKCIVLSENPDLGRKRDNLLPGIRSFPFKRYILFYRKEQNIIEIIRILSAYRDIDSIF
ncbi:MAG: type II toxin-antitoxin system RelE/ParE family toxin [Spirochaetales bacterium]|nr:type II toxin-antitoxin system RelE/ParE family toxin [Spirochaetales bacterium]